jgi:hypothetical protein
MARRKCRGSLWRCIAVADIHWLFFYARTASGRAQFGCRAVREFRLVENCDAVHNAASPMLRFFRA